MKQSLRKTLFLLLAPVCFFACAHVHAQLSGSARQVTAREYADFLNQNAATDPNYLYDEKMGTDTDAACIVRMGAPGKYFYQVIAGRENFPVTYVNNIDEGKYISDTSDSIADGNENNDASLKSSQINFIIVTTDASQLLMIPGAPIIADAAGTAADYFWGIMAGIGFGMLGGRGEAIEEPAPIDTSVASGNWRIRHDEYSMSTAPSLFGERDVQKSELRAKGEESESFRIVENAASSSKLITTSAKKNRLLTNPSHPLSVPSILKRVAVAFLSLTRPAFAERTIDYSLQNETTPMAILGIDSFGNFLKYYREPKNLFHHQREKDLSRLTISQQIDQELRIFEQQQVERKVKNGTVSELSIHLFNTIRDCLTYRAPWRFLEAFNRNRARSIFSSANSDAILAEQVHLAEMITFDGALRGSASRIPALSYKLIEPEDPNFDERWDRAIELQLHAIKAARDYIQALEELEKSQSDTLLFLRDHSIGKQIEYTKNQMVYTELRLFDMRSKRAEMTALAAHRKVFERNSNAADFYNILSDAILKTEKAVTAFNKLIEAYEYKANFDYENLLQHKKGGWLDVGVKESIFEKLQTCIQQIEKHRVTPLMNNLELLKSKLPQGVKSDQRPASIPSLLQYEHQDY